jgi:hypothetical protein
MKDNTILICGISMTATLYKACPIQKEMMSRVTKMMICLKLSSNKKETNLEGKSLEGQLWIFKPLPSPIMVMQN